MLLCSDTDDLGRALDFDSASFTFRVPRRVCSPYLESLSGERGGVVVTTKPKSSQGLGEQSSGGGGGRPSAFAPLLQTQRLGGGTSRFTGTTSCKPSSYLSLPRDTLVTSSRLSALPLSTPTTMAAEAVPSALEAAAAAAVLATPAPVAENDRKRDRSATPPRPPGAGRRPRKRAVRADVPFTDDSPCGDLASVPAARMPAHLAHCIAAAARDDALRRGLAAAAEAEARGVTLSAASLLTLAHLCSGGDRWEVLAERAAAGVDGATEDGSLPDSDPTRGAALLDAAAALGPSGRAAPDDRAATARARLLAVAGDPEAALRVATDVAEAHAASPALRPASRLRTFAPALGSFCARGDASGAGRALDAIESAGHAPTEAEVRRLLICADRAGDAALFGRALAIAGEELPEVGTDTADAVERFFRDAAGTGAAGRALAPSPGADPDAPPPGPTPRTGPPAAAPRGASAAWTPPTSPPRATRPPAGSAWPPSPPPTTAPSSPA